MNNIKCNGPKWEPKKWEMSDEEHDINNCYSYIFNYKEKNLEDKLQPGQLSNDEYKKTTCEDIIEKMKKDYEKLGIRKLRDINEEIECTNYKIALFIDNKGKELDYHFYRQDLNGYWSHKTGHDPISNVDASGKLITDPENCDRNYDKKNNDKFKYNKFCGYFSVKYNGGPFFI